MEESPRVAASVDPMRDEYAPPQLVEIGTVAELTAGHYFILSGGQNTPLVTSVSP